MDALFFTVPSVLQQVQGGRLKAIAVASAKRSGALPGVPTLAEAGLKEFDASPWFGLLAPAATPRPVIERLQSELLRAWQEPDVRAKLAEQGAEPLNAGSESFAATLRADLARWTEAVRRSGATID